MTIEAYKADQAAAAPPKAKVTPPAEQKKASGLLGLLSKVTAAIRMKTTSKVLMGINSPLARVAGVMMQVNATVPVRRSGGEGSGGGSQGIVTAAIQGVYRAAVQEQQARYHMYQAWGKAWTQARHVSLKDLLSHPGQVLSNLGDAAKGIYDAYQEVPPHIRQHWWEKQKAYEAKQVAEEKARQEAAKRAEEATFIGGFNKSMNSLGGLVTDFWGGVTERNDHKLDSTYDFVNWILIGIPGGIKNIADMNESNYNRIQGNTDIYGWANWLTSGTLDMAGGALNPKDPFSKEHWANSIGLAGLFFGLKGSPVKGIAGEKIPPAKVSTAPIIDSATATRSRVEANVADSRAARENSNIRDYFKAEQSLEQERANGKSSSQKIDTPESLDGHTPYEHRYARDPDTEQLLDFEWVTTKVADLDKDQALLDTAAIYKGKLSNTVLKSGKGNFSYTKVDLDIKLPKNEYYAHSQVEKHSGNPNIKDISEMPEEPKFEAKVAPNGLGIESLRDDDTEYKILNNIAKDIGDKPNVKGKITLFTEKDTCGSCNYIISQFKEYYKFIQIEVVHNQGKPITPIKTN